MPYMELFRDRQKRLRGEVPDVYQYEELPQTLKNQIYRIIQDSILGCYRNLNEGQFYAEEMYNIICKEFGVLRLRDYDKPYLERYLNYFLNQSDIEKQLDMIELAFKVINCGMRQVNIHNLDHHHVQLADDAIEELNQRFKMHGVGYQFENNEIIRVDSQFMHSEAVKPTLKLLGSNKAYAGSNDEFLTAHNHYRKGDYKECLNACLKSLESLMKAIHTLKGWPFEEKWSARQLIKSCFEKELIPNYLQEQFASLKSLVETGIPPLRNKEGSHGQGTKIKELPEYVASYGIHLTASNLLFLAKSAEI